MTTFVAVTTRARRRSRALAQVLCALALTLGLGSVRGTAARAGACTGPATLDVERALRAERSRPRLDWRRDVAGGVARWRFVATAQPYEVLHHLYLAAHPRNADDMVRLYTEPMIELIVWGRLADTLAVDSIRVRVTNVQEVVHTRQTAERIELSLGGCRDVVSLGAPFENQEKYLSFIGRSLFSLEYRVPEPARLLRVLRDPVVRVTLGNRDLTLILLGAG